MLGRYTPGKKMEIKVINHVDIRVRAGQLKIRDNICYVVIITLLTRPLARYRTILWLQLNHNSRLNIVPRCAKVVKITRNCWAGRQLVGRVTQVLRSPVCL
jgi:hypothetical protein